MKSPGDEIRKKAQLGAESGCLLRLVWMLAGHGVLLVLLLVITQSDRGLLSLVSVAFWVVVGLVVWARHVDVTRCNGTMTDGETPATLGDFKRFRSWLVGISGAAWVLAHAL